MLSILAVVPVAANSTPQALPFHQNWTNTGLITTNNVWTGVPGVSGFQGATIAVTGADPQQVTVDDTTLNVLANQTDPAGLSQGGVAEFEISDPVVAIKGSGRRGRPRASCISVNTTGLTNIHVAYNLRDIDASTNNAFQQVALQYRLASTGSFTNLPAGYVADATNGPSDATLVTPVSVTLPTAANNQPVVQLRVITADANGPDEWVGIDDISVTGVPPDTAPTVAATTPSDGAVDVPVDSNLQVTFSEPVDVANSWFDISCDSSGTHTATVSGGPTTFTLDPATDFAPSEPCTLTIVASDVTDQDTNDPPDAMASERDRHVHDGGSSRRGADRDVHDPGGHRGRRRRRREPVGDLQRAGGRCRRMVRARCATRAARTRRPSPVARRPSRSIRPRTSRRARDAAWPSSTRTSRTRTRTTRRTPWRMT